MRVLDNALKGRADLLELLGNNAPQENLDEAYEDVQRWDEEVDRRERYILEMVRVGDRNTRFGQLGVSHDGDSGEPRYNVANPTQRLTAEEQSQILQYAGVLERESEANARLAELARARAAPEDINEAQEQLRLRNAESNRPSHISDLTEQHLPAAVPEDIELVRNERFYNNRARRRRERRQLQPTPVTNPAANAPMPAQEGNASMVVLRRQFPSCRWEIRAEQEGYNRRREYLVSVRHP